MTISSKSIHHSGKSCEMIMYSSEAPNSWSRRFVKWEFTTRIFSDRLRHTGIAAEMCFAFCGMSCDKSLLPPDDNELIRCAITDRRGAVVVFDKAAFSFTRRWLRKKKSAKKIIVVFKNITVRRIKCFISLIYHYIFLTPTVSKKISIVKLLLISVWNRLNCAIECDWNIPRQVK